MNPYQSGVHMDLQFLYDPQCIILLTKGEDFYDFFYGLRYAWPCITEGHGAIDVTKSINAFLSSIIGLRQSSMSGKQYYELKADLL